MAPTGRYHKPRIEPLESRLVPDAALTWAAFFQTPVSETAHPAVHTQPQLSILTDVQTQVVPAGIGVQANGKAMPNHTHGSTGRPNAEPPILHDSQLQEFIKIWAQLLSAPQALDSHADAAHTSTKTVGGQLGAAFEALIPRDREGIVAKADSLKLLPTSGPDPTLVSLALAERSNQVGSAIQASFIPNVTGFSAKGTFPHLAAWAAPLPAPRLDASRQSISGSDSTPNPKEAAEATETSAIDSDLDLISRRLAPHERESATAIDRPWPDSTQDQEQRTELPTRSDESDETENPGS